MTANKIDDFDYVTAVDLNYTVNDKQKPVYHFIYASQLYGTIFGVYAQFEGGPVAGGETFEIKRILFKLINYKGSINIGFTGDFEWDDVENNLHFGLRGASIAVEDEFPFVPAIQVPKGRTPMFFTRRLYPLPDFEVYFKKRNADDDSHLNVQLISEPPFSTLFDSEFNDRDGIDFYNGNLKPGMQGYQKKRKSKQDKSSEFMPPIVGIRCITSNVNLYY